MAAVFAVLVVRGLLVPSMRDRDDQWYVAPLMFYVGGVVKNGTIPNTRRQ